MDTDEKRIKALKWLAIEDVWGIGRQWKMKQEKLSPRYSTNIKEVITVHA